MCSGARPATATQNVAGQGRFAHFRAFKEGLMNRLFMSALIPLVLSGAPLLAQRATKPAPAARAAAASTSTEVINLNTATAAQLGALPGIGPKTADLIVQYRQKNGPFKKVEEIMNVRGVGEKSFLKLKARITVTAPKAGE
jgi:competence protein ComEA